MFAPKTNTQFADSIISTVMNNHRGYIPMERPYSMLWEGDPADDDDGGGVDELASLEQDDLLGIPLLSSHNGDTGSDSEHSSQDSARSNGTSDDLMSLPNSDNVIEL